MAEINWALALAVAPLVGFIGMFAGGSNEQISLSKMTFSHQMIRLVFTEQIYRACTIIKGEPYHHE